MRILLRWLDQLRRTTVAGLPQFCSALVATLEDITAAIKTWQELDHNADGTHAVIHLREQDAAAAARAGHIGLYWDGTDLKTVKPDGTVETVQLV